MSEEREQNWGASANDEPSLDTDDVEAHKKHGKDADPIAGDERDDVEAHVKAGKDR